MKEVLLVAVLWAAFAAQAWADTLAFKNARDPYRQLDSGDSLEIRDESPHPRGRAWRAGSGVDELLAAREM